MNYRIWYSTESFADYIIANTHLRDKVDFPELETIVMAKPTRSLRLYYQILGRGIRIHPNKKDCWAVDMCDNQSVFGKIEDLHLEKDFKGLWRVSSNGRALTNVNF